MRIIFSTPNTLYTYDFDSRTLTFLAGEPKEFYGISGDSGRLVLSHTRIDGDRFRRHEDYLASPTGILSVAEGGQCLHTAPVLMQPHQIECYGASILCANSGRNCVTVFDAELRPHDFYPTTARWDIGPGDRKNNHFNSVHVHGGRVYVVAHNHERDSAVWVFEWPELELVDVIPTRTEWAHNVWVLENDLIVCNSRAGALYSVSQKQDIWRIPAGGYITRGLAANDDYIVVGLSALASRCDRRNSDSGFAVLDRKTLKTLDTFIFSAIGAVHEIRLLNEVDACHAGGIIALPFSFEADGVSAPGPSCGQHPGCGAAL